MGKAQVQQFIEMVKRNNFVVLDTETTGLHDCEIVEIAIADHNGQALMDTPVRPMGGIPASATGVHGISDGMVENAPTWKAVRQRVAEIITDKNVIIYNADFDMGAMMSSDRHAGLTARLWWDAAQVHCAMKIFAEIYGDWNDYHKSYRWQRLETAAAFYRVPAPEAHRAMADVMTTLAVVRAMAKSVI